MNVFIWFKREDDYDDWADGLVKMLVGLQRDWLVKKWIYKEENIKEAR